MPNWLSQPSFAYLFHGQQHLGKKLFATEFIQNLLNIDNTRFDLHPDIITFLPEEGKKEISVKSIREKKIKLFQPPQIAPYLIAYLPYLDLLNQEGFNALLKIIEEPIPNTVFITVASNLNKIPATVLSRLVSVKFNKVSNQDIYQALIAKKYNKQEAQKITQQANGLPGIAFSTKLQELFLNYQNFSEQLLSAVSLSQRIDILQKINSFCAEQKNESQAWKDFLSVFRHNLQLNFSKLGYLALIWGQGITDAEKVINTAIQPRLILEATSVNIEQNHLPKITFYSKLFPLTLS